MEITPRNVTMGSLEKPDGAERMREGEQLAFAAIPEGRTLARDFDTAHRYRKNGAREKVLGAVYTPPRVAAALTRWAVRASSDAVNFSSILRCTKIRCTDMQVWPE